MSIAPAAQSILDQATALWPNRSRASDGTLGDPAHAARQSDHNPDADGVVLAADLTHDPANGCDAHAWAEATRLRCRDGEERRPSYIISNGRICSPTGNWAWRTYTGSNAHTHHVHTSINKSEANDDSPWFTEEGLTVAEVQQIIDTLTGVVQRQGKLTRQTIRNLYRAETKANRRLSDAEIDAILAAIEDDA